MLRLRPSRHRESQMLQKSLIRRLDLITLQLFVAVHEEGTLTRAATREAIAVSAASKRLMELEEALGISLFVRQAKGMTLTPALYVIGVCALIAVALLLWGLPQKLRTLDKF